MKFCGDQLVAFQTAELRSAEGSGGAYGHEETAR